MRVSVYLLAAALGAAACGQVKEKEVKLELLPPGETNASYNTPTTNTDSGTDTETETDTTDTTTLTNLQKMLVEIEAQRTAGACYSTATNTSGTASNGCDFSTTFTVTDAIVTSVQNCAKVDDGSGVCSGGRKGLDWAMIQEIGGGGMLLNTFGWYTGITTPLKVGNKISFTASKMKYRFGRGYLFKIDETTLQIATATAAELFKLSAEVVDLDDIDVTKVKADNLYRLVSGSFKVSNQTVTVSGDSATWFALTTKAQPLDNGLYVRGSGVVEKGKCYTAQNVPLVWSTTPTAPTAGGYALMDKATFDTIHATNSLGSITETDCTKAGF